MCDAGIEAGRRKVKPVGAIVFEVREDEVDGGYTARAFGYDEITRQSGWQMRITMQRDGEKHEVIPNHRCSQNRHAFHSSLLFHKSRKIERNTDLYHELNRAPDPAAPRE